MDGPSRRQVLIATGAAALASFASVTPARATRESFENAVRKVVGEAAIRKGKVTLDVPPLVENGNTVSLDIAVDSPMTKTDYVKSIHIFNEKNPQPNIASFYLGPRAGRASVSTRCRLATSQDITAIAELSDGSFWSDSAEVIVTIAACVEDMP